MTKRLIMTEGFAAAAKAAKMSPAIEANGFLFLTGVTGGDLRGNMPTDPQTQFRNCFEKIGSVLGEADVGFDAVVEMTSYHVGLRQHFDLFDKVRLDYFSEPWPAWTAVEVAGLRREGAVVEIRVVAMNG